MQEAYDGDSPKGEPNGSPQQPPSDTHLGEAEYWEISDNDNFTDNMAQDYEFSELVTLSKEPESQKKGVLVLVARLPFYRYETHLVR